MAINYVKREDIVKETQKKRGKSNASREKRKVFNFNETIEQSIKNQFTRKHFGIERRQFSRIAKPRWPKHRKNGMEE